MSDLASRLENMSPLQKAVYALRETQSRLESLQRRGHEPVAIIGMSCRFPGDIKSPDDYWKLLVSNQEAIGEIPPERWDSDAFYDPNPQTPGKMCTKWGGCLSDASMFDNHFFGISDREATMIDPQQRILLELAWEVVDDAGIPLSDLKGLPVGVFIGIGANEYIGKIAGDSTLGNPFASTGNALCVAANRISYAFDFQGPSLAIDTACSSSLVAIHQAVASLRNGESTLALVGGVNLILNPLTTINLTKAGVCSPDGKVRAFDAQANGYVRSDGAGLICLKPLSSALKDGDRIYATIMGSATNHNGSANGLSSPRRETQEALLRQAYQSAKTPPSEVSFVETHGTATPIGDAIEIAALSNVLCQDRPQNKPLHLGAVKTNLGHTETASGMASVIKTVLAMQHKTLPSNLHFQVQNANIDTIETLRFLSANQPWTQVEDRPYVAGVSAFGFGGCNAHVVLQSYSPTTSEPNQILPDDSSQKLPLILTAKTEASLRLAAIQMKQFLQSATPDWYDVCHTAALKRELLDCRLVISASDANQAIESLSHFVDGIHDARVFIGRRTQNGTKTKSSLDGQTRSLEESIVDGEPIDWKTIFVRKGRLVSLPKYPWQRQRHWLESAALPDALLDDSQRSANSKAGSTRPTAVSESTQQRKLLNKRPDLNTAFVAASTNVEKMLDQRWREVLRLESIGIDDNFFELGGDSLQAGSLLNQLQKELHQTIHFMALFQSQTIRELAQYLDATYPDAVQLWVEQSSPTSIERPLQPVQVSNGSIPKLNRRRTLERPASEIESMSDREVETLLLQQLKSQNNTRDPNV